MENIEMISIQGGTFMMGDEIGDLWGACSPIHKVTVPTFHISKYQITQKQWQKIMGNNPSHFKGENCPVEKVSWNDTQEFLKKLNQKTGKKYRLPTEAEWEFAARGGNQSKNYKYAGSDNLDEVAWYFENSNYETNPVGTKKPNELGIYDMSGNVWEWCEDTWHDDYQNAPQNGAVWITGGNNKRRVLRGGSWFSVDINSRVVNRNWNVPAFRFINDGFRLAL